MLTSLFRLACYKSNYSAVDKEAFAQSIFIENTVDKIDMLPRGAGLARVCLEFEAMTLQQPPSLLDYSELLVLSVVVRDAWTSSPVPSRSGLANSAFPAAKRYSSFEPPLLEQFKLPVHFSAPIFSNSS